jgi:aryl-alcohol dehydrogenase-like predicted oxidoreductase
MGRSSVERVTEMTHRPLGDSGLMVSAVGVGCNAFGRRVGLDAVRGIVDAADDTGVTFLDTSDSYAIGQSEEMVGVALEGRRDRFVVATKFGSDMRGTNGADHGARGARRYVRRAVEASLRRLRTDWIDLYQLHFPDPVTPIAETLSVLTDLVREGKVRYLGCSNVAAWQVADWDWTARTSGFERFVSVQKHYSLLNRSVEADIVPAAQRFGLGLLPYFPLEFGLLTGKYRRGREAPYGSRARSGPSPWFDNADWDRIEALGKYAEARGLSLLDVAVAGLSAQPAVGSVIAGATSGDQVRANAAAVRWRPDADDLAELDAITKG